MKTNSIRTYFVLALVACFSFFSMAQEEQQSIQPNLNYHQSTDDSIVDYQTYAEFRTPAEIQKSGVLSSRSCGCDVSNLLPDGDFESLLPVTSGLGVNCSCNVSSVCVGHEPRDKCLNSLWLDDLWDHTTGSSSGHYLLVDGGNGSVWSETVPVTAGQEYVFSFWQIREISDNAGNNSTQTFDLRINGATIASFNTASALEDAWTQYCTSWTATFSAAATTIEIVQTSGTDFNDYGIDDIEFGQCEVPCVIPELKDYFDFSNSLKNCYRYKFYSLINESNLCYAWYIDGDLVSTDPNFTYDFEADGAYEICVKIYCCEDPNVEPVLYCETILINCQEDECGCTIIDQLPNGDFETPSLGVMSGLPVTCTCSSGSVCIGHEPRDKCNNSLWINDLWDNTLGTPDGHFLIVDGANGTIWSENISVDAGSTYIFEFWEVREISTGGGGSAQTFDVLIDGNLIASFNTAGAGATDWTLYCASWVAPYSSTSSTIRIVQTSGTGWNDYGIDDIQFGKCAGSKMNTAQVIEEKSVELNLYPNPAINNVTLEWDESLEINQVSIYNADGKLVKEVSVSTQGNLTVDVNDLTDGIYLLRTDANNVERFVIKK